MNAKQVKYIRQTLREQQVDIRNIKFHQVGDQVSEGRQIYQKAKKDHQAGKRLTSQYTVSHRQGVPSAGKSSKFAGFKEKTLKWQKNFGTRVVYDESMSQEKKVQRGIA
jgi:hypothetical protein